MRISRPAAALLSLLLFLAAPAVAADDKPAAQPAAKPAATSLQPPPDATTHHQIKLGDRQLAYTATAGTLAIKADKGEKQADTFFLAFTLTAVAPAQPPATYPSNAGPAAASAAR